MDPYSMVFTVYHSIVFSAHFLFHSFIFLERSQASLWRCVKQLPQVSKEWKILWKLIAYNRVYIGAVVRNKGISGGKLICYDVLWGLMKEWKRK